MKITRAVEVLSDLLGDGPYWPEEERREAVKLGIEALKSIVKDREGFVSHHGRLLTGETEEGN